MTKTTADSTVHLICNSHLDPVWLWEWPEGAAEALSLARTVCDLCDEFDTFVFNRNEVQFYEWIEEYDPALFKRIRKLVARGRWHVMGGWYLQPDCNLPSGESFVRQILTGKLYFREKFGVEPTTAANVDAFGHNRGLVQILRKSGYDSYFFCRPKLDEAPFPTAEFTWVGFDGSEITAALGEPHYNSPPGGAVEKIEEWMERDRAKTVRQVPWGVGNHGGGPSREDLAAIARLVKETKRTTIVHSSPERYFADIHDRIGPLPRHSGDLNPWAVGCYTSMMRLKRKHRQLENELFLTEKMATTAWAQGLLEYPEEEIGAATRSLLANEFHDILSGTSIPSGEETAINDLGHGLTYMARVKSRAFFALAAGQPAGIEGKHPILVYNPHPFVVDTTVECEIQPAWPDRDDEYGVPTVTGNRRKLLAQAEQQESNINEDHRKRVVFRAKLKPGQMNRFDCSFEKVRRKPAPKSRIRDGKLRFKTAELDVVINTRTGYLDRYRAEGEDYLSATAARPIVMQDDADPWGMKVSSFRKVAGRFKLMNQTAAARFAGVSQSRLSPVRIIEDGPVRTVVEALFVFGDSAICQRYKLPRVGTEVEIETRVLWQEKDRMLKLSFPTPLKGANLVGQVAYGSQELPSDGSEAVAQKWLAVAGGKKGTALTIINDSTYGCDFKGGEVRLSLLRAPAHAGHPTDSGRPILQQDRFTPRIDQGEHLFRFWLNGGEAGDRLSRIDREASAHNERPFALGYWPEGGGKKPEAGPTLSDGVIQVTAFKRAEGKNDLVIRLFNPTDRKRKTTLSVECFRLKTQLQFGPFEIKTLRANRRTRRLREVDLLEG